MRAGKTFLLLIFILFAFGYAAKTQGKWSLDDCIAYAIKNNLDIESQSITTEKNREYLNQSKRGRLPSISAGTDYGINFGKSVDPNTNDVTYSSFASNSYSANAGIAVFEGFIRNNRVAYNRFKYLAGIENEKDLKVNIGFKVMDAFHNTLYYQGLLEIAKEQKELSELNLEKVKKQAEVGLSAKTDLLEIEARLADEELLVIRTGNNLKASLLELKRAMNYPVSNDLQLQDINDSEIIRYPVFENTDSVFALAMKFLPSVKAKMQQLNAVEKALAVSKGSLYPSVYFGGGYYTGFYETRMDENGNTISFRDQFKNNASQSVGVQLSIPVFNRWSLRSEIKQSKLDVEKEKVDLENFKNQLYYEIESYCQDLSAVSAEYLQAKKQTESNQLAFNVAEKKKEQGMFNIIDFYASKNLLSNAQGELLRTKLLYLLKRKTLDFYMGKTIFQTETNK